MRSKELLITEEQNLFEINMSPSSLQQLAKQIDARAGMEFEMIVPDSEGSYQDETEPDYEQDQRCHGIDDVCEFFHDGDFNSRHEIRRLRERMENDYFEWQHEQVSDDWDSNGFEFFCEYLDREDPFLRDDDAVESAREQVAADHPDLDSNSEEFSELVSERLDEMESAYYQEQWDDQGRNYDDARDEFIEENREEYDDGQWLDSQGIHTMSDVENAYEITWPHWTSGNDGGRSVQEVADSFRSAIGRKVNWSSNYHGGRREPNAYVVEPDGSLEGDNPGDNGLEFVSPPLPINELLADLVAVREWAASEGCYTNSSTGLHINVSVPKLQTVAGDLDYVKLALLLGDKYVLDRFGRAGNTYCKSALEIVKDKVRHDPSKAQDLLKQMKGNLAGLASKVIHSGVTQKYTSINTKEGYVEFRSPGGDWLNENFEQIESTLLRFVVALDAACDPTKYREEYLTKLYKILSPATEQGKDTIKYFADYVAGKMPKAALRSFVKQAQLERRLKKGNLGGKYWWAVSNPAHSFASIEVVATTKEEAIEKALEPSGYPNWRNTIQTVVAKPLRPFGDQPVRAQVGEPEPIGRSRGAMLGDRPSNPDGNYVISPEDDRSIVAYRFRAADIDDAQIVARQWRQENPGRVWIVQRDENRTLGQPSNPGRRNMPNVGTQQEMERRLGWPDQTGELTNYEIVRRDNMATVFVLVANNDREAMRKYGDWLAAAGYPEDTEDFGIKRIDGGQMDLSEPQQAPQRQYVIFRGMDRSDVVATFLAANDRDAQARVERYRREHPGAEYNLDRFAVQSDRTHTSDQDQGGIIDVATDVAQNFAPRTSTTPGQGQQSAGRYRILRHSTQETVDNRTFPTLQSAVEYALANNYPIGRGYAVEEIPTTQSSQPQDNWSADFERRMQNPPRTLTTPGQPQQQFTGNWLVRDMDDNVIYRFGGVGNNQGDANRVAMEWLRRNPRHMRDGVTVLPEML